MKKLIILSAVLLSLSISSCKKYLDIEPVGKVIPTTVEDFRALMTSAYLGFPKHKALLAFRTDELTLNNDNDNFSAVKDIYSWKDAGQDGLTAPFPYITFYKSIFYTNQVIADVEAKAGKSAETAQLKAEAYLLRAYAHFELLNMYAKPYNSATASTDRGVPISTTIDIEQKFPVATIEAVYNQIFSDLAAGQQLLTVDKWDSGKNYRFSKRAALALSARIYEFRNEWDKALTTAQAVLTINNELEDLNVAGSLLPNDYKSKENIMSLEEVMDSRTSNSSYISAHLLGIYDQTNDLRFHKYFNIQDLNYVSVKGNSDALKITFRNGEMYLIAAEAALQTGKNDVALQRLLDLKAKRLTPTYFQAEKTKISGLTAPNLMKEILAERERELAIEGHRWYDLRRYGQPQITHTIGTDNFVLIQNDPRYTIRFPKDAIANNPGLQ
ncbi:RagB/SusD family nutrient uptake outer membrane protein [Pedobacter hiemivivus]|uniref:RagB/SusD family nutrient uptake outer membrane protein n=1 Tax=Pedobacter hiemivivus TaxID=2530454 RepID=A0A4R0M9I9_9SPHI|nr:RagB/SusD family nutrient uptake outer membrane protein [Pedobacter hiemivivus]TCC82412.1 RagB/SusD family nutrient uptake outer membrane protein [Pedobacter hiemivivus]